MIEEGLSCASLRGYSSVRQSLCWFKWPPAFLSVSCLPLAMSSVGAIRDQRKRVFRWCVVALTTPNRLMAYAARLNGAKGAKLARAVAEQVRAKSGSVMETELAAIAFTAEVYGGLGIAEALINAPVALSEEARRVARTDWVVLDFYWPKAHFGIEYNGRTAHASADQQDRDSRKRDGRMVDGIETATMTNSQFQNVTECTALLDRGSGRAGKKRRKRRAADADAHRKLRRRGKG